MTQRFGENPADYPATGGHTGWDWATPTGTVVLAAADGVVTLAGSDPAWPGRGWHVVINHGDGWQSYVMHLSDLYVMPLERVEAGQPIGASGGAPGTPGAGYSTGPHLHFDVRYQGVPVDCGPLIDGAA